MNLARDTKGNKKVFHKVLYSKRSKYKKVFQTKSRKNVRLLVNGAGAIGAIPSVKDVLVREYLNKINLSS